MESMNSGQVTAFEQDATHALREIRVSVAEMLVDLPVQGRPSHVARILKIPQTLAWRVAQVAGGANLYSIPQILPGETALDKFLKAAATQGVSDTKVERVRDAVCRLGRLIDVHAGDQPTLELMLASRTASEERRQQERIYRKGGFTCASYAWGVQTRLRLGAYFHHPQPDSEFSDLAIVRGHHGLTRIRPGAPLTISRRFLARPDGQLVHPQKREPIDPQGERGRNLTLLPAFCTSPLPSIQVTEEPDGQIVERLSERPVGEHGAVTLFSGEVIREYAQPRHGVGSHLWGHQIPITIPTRELVMDVFVHASLAENFSPTLRMYGSPDNLPWLTPDISKLQRLPCAEEIRHVGKGLDAVQLEGVPEYEELIRFVCERRGWASDQFELYRTRVPFPIVMTSVGVEYYWPGIPHGGR